MEGSHDHVDQKHIVKRGMGYIQAALDAIERAYSIIVNPRGRAGGRSFRTKIRRPPDGVRKAEFWGAGWSNCDRGPRIVTEN